MVSIVEEREKEKIQTLTDYSWNAKVPVMNKKKKKKKNFAGFLDKNCIRIMLDIWSSSKQYIYIYI